MFRAFSRKEILLFLLFLVCYSYFYVPAEWNENSRYDLVYSVIDEGRLSIDSYHENTQDKSFYNGHYYSDKAPGSSFLGLVAYFIFRPLMFNQNMAEYLIRFFVVSLPSALLCVLIYRFSGNFTKNEKYRLFVTIAYGLGTLTFPYSILFYGHQIAGVLLFSGFYLIFMNKNNLCIKHLFISGLLSGLAFITEYPTILISVLIFFYIFAFLKDKERLLFFGLGFVPPLLLLSAYNFLCFGNPFTTGYSYLVYPESLVAQSQGFFGITFPGFQSVYGILFSPYRGLFFFSPFLLLSLPGFYYLYRQKKFRKEFALFLLSVLVFFAWSSSYSVWWGGWAPGPRHFAPVLPFMVLPAVFCLGEWKDWRKGLAYVLLAISIFMVSLVTITDPNLPEKTYNPLFEHTLPLILKGNIGLNFGNLMGLQGLLSLVPLLAALIIISWLLLNEPGGSKWRK